MSRGWYAGTLKRRPLSRTCLSASGMGGYSRCGAGFRYKAALDRTEESRCTVLCCFAAIVLFCVKALLPFWFSLLHSGLFRKRQQQGHGEHRLPRSHPIRSACGGSGLISLAGGTARSSPLFAHAWHPSSRRVAVRLPPDACSRGSGACPPAGQAP